MQNKAPAPPKGIVWLASYPKSGNTWLRHFLHSLIAAAGAHAADGVQAAYTINEINRFSTGAFGRKRFEALLGKDAVEASPAEIAAVRHAVQAQICEEEDGGSRSAVSEHTVGEAVSSWSVHVRSWTGKPDRTIHVMRYEDMLDRPEETFGALARHLLVDPSPQVLREAIDMSSFERLQAQEEETGFREKPEHAERFFREGRHGQWREVLSDRQARRIVDDHRAQMERFGYVPEEFG